MIGSLSGVLSRKSPDAILVDVGGVGYEVSVPVNTLSDLPPEGSEVSLQIYTHVREGAIQLFGFSSAGEKRVFTSLLGISGVGPKLALNVLSGINYDDFAASVEAEDVARLSRIPGLGKKTANRIVLEMKGKLPSGAGPADKVSDDALSALVNLGYKRTEAMEAVEKARRKGAGSVEDVLREALKGLTGE
jgi:Holliday junction DNA helicase RuvA